MKHRVFLILNMSVVSALIVLGFSVISPILPQYALSFSVSISMTGWAVSAFSLARMVMDMPAGILADNLGRKNNMLIGLTLIVMSAVMSGMATSYLWLVVGRVIQGIGSAFYVTSATAWVAEVSAGEYRGRFMSLYLGFIFAGSSFGPAIGGYSASYFGLSGPFFIYGGLTTLGLLATIPLRETPHATPRGVPVSLRDIKDVISNRSFLMVSLAVLALFFLRAGVLFTLIPLYASLNLGLNEGQIGMLMTVVAVIIAIVSFPSGWLSDRIGRKTPIISCLFLNALIVLLIPWQKEMDSLLILISFCGLATGLQGSIDAWLADVVPESRLGTAMGIYRVIGDIGHVLGPISVTYATSITGGLTIPFLSFVIPAVIATITGIVLIWAQDPVIKRKTSTAID